jgi:isopentenyl-diphosphate delta-isomerase
MLNPEVILVDDNDEVIGFEDKLVAHQKGLKHRAISVLLFNNSGDWLIQKRAKEKYHSGGLWTNTCCSHPYPNENTKDSANRRLEEEMGMEANLSYAFNFSYNVNLDNDLIENELDHVYIGFTENIPRLNPEEASDYKYCSTEFLEKDIENYPNKYTEWFKIIFDKVKMLDLKGVKK